MASKSQTKVRPKNSQNKSEGSTLNWRRTNWRVSLILNQVGLWRESKRERIWSDWITMNTRWNLSEMESETGWKRFSNALEILEPKGESVSESNGSELGAELWSSSVGTSGMEPRATSSGAIDSLLVLLSVGDLAFFFLKKVEADKRKRISDSRSGSAFETKFIREEEKKIWFWLRISDE